MATSLAAMGHRLLRASEDSGDSSVGASSGPYATKPIREYLTRFSPVEAGLWQRRDYAVTYNIVHWSGSGGGTRAAGNSVVGQVAIERRQGNKQVRYDVEQETQIGGVKNFVKAQIVCNRDGWNSLRHWELNSYSTGLTGQADPISQIAEEGQCKNGHIWIEGSSYHYSYSTKKPVVSQWTVVDYLAHNASARLNVTFDLLQDLSLFKPNQSLVYDGQVRVKLEDGLIATFQTYAQTGQGVLPIHYLVDSRGRPQLVTSSIVSWALSG